MCSLFITDAMESCRDNVFVGYEGDGFVEICGTITLEGEVEFEVLTLRVVIDNRTITIGR